MRKFPLTILLYVVVCLTPVFIMEQGGAAFAQTGSPPAASATVENAASLSAREKKALDHETRETETWQTILAGIEKDLDLRIRQTEALRTILPAMKVELGDALAKADNRLDQLLLLRGVAGETPWAYRSILIQLRELERYVELKRSPLDDRQARLAQAKKDYSSIRAIRKKGLTLDYAAGTSDSLDAPLARFREFKKDLDEIKADVDDALTQADQLQAGITQVQDQIQAGFIDALKRYYFSRSDTLLTLEGWQSLDDDMEEWAEAFPRFAGPLVGWVRWTLFFAYLAGFFILLCLAAAVVKSLRARAERPGNVSLETDSEAKRKTQEETSQAMSLEAEGGRLETDADNEAPAAPQSDPDLFGPPSGLDLQQRLGRLLVFLGLSLYLADQLTLFTNNQFVALGWVVLIAFGVMLVLSRRMSLTQASETPPLVRRPIFVFSVLFALGAALQALNIPATGVGLVWSLAALWASIRLYRLRAQAGNASRLRNFSAQAGYLMALMVVAGLAGFGPQSLIVTQAIFMLLLTLWCSRLLHQAVVSFATARGGEARPGLGLPFAQTIIYAFYIFWVLQYMGGPGFADYVMDLSLTIGVATITPHAVITLVVAFFLAKVLLSWLGSLFSMPQLGGRKMDPGLSHALKNISSYLVWLGFMLLTLYLFGVSLHALAWIASGLSVGIGFGLKDIVNNFVSGLIIMFGGSIKKGDIIQQGKNLGEVESVSIRNTIIRTLDNTMVIIPNSSFLRGEIVNLSYHDTTMRLTIPVAVAPGAKIKKVRKLLLEVAKENEAVLKKPKPEVNIRQFGRFGVEFDLYIWIDDFMKKFKTESDILSEIDKRFQENKIMMAFQGVKVKYKPKGTEEMQLEEARAALREKRGETFKLVRQMRRVHSRRRWNLSRVTVRLPE
ncbi:mechanosensitive ion channel [Desulfovibrio sulfodismutans]|uniref:Mechanosensitive ion channel n=1 Tax=Desulfolutivibrio sulfodismutans TaxID=63561 RepID=A0A7K3NKH4_9BACT|nr:mechanosensitive ion channel domain-containing protein [Desulfolutivibrio sulfodismutans]NDY56255.1 mechanosensitive ion channel [Desulfolutivibrio sulfodismutans]